MGAAMRKVEGWGWIGVGTTEKGVARVVLPKSSKKAVEEALRDFRSEVNQSLAENCLQAISRYLKGEPVNFERIPIDWDFVPPVHRSILLTLRKTVPLGQTITYGELARRCGMSRAARLVGQAMAKNPVPNPRALSQSYPFRWLFRGLQWRDNLEEETTGLGKAHAKKFSAD